MTRYLLDTNIVSDLVRNPAGRVAVRIAEVGVENICTSIVVASELRFGAAKSGSPRLIAQVDTLLGALEILPLETPADLVYGAIRDALETSGAPIGANDLLIAAHALAIDCMLVTNNVREFRRVPDLQVVDWLLG